MYIHWEKAQENGYPAFQMEKSSYHWSIIWCVKKYYPKYHFSVLEN